MEPAARFVANPYLRARADQGVFGMRVEKRDLLGDAARIGEIVVVLSCNITPSRQRDAAIERSSQTLVLLMIDAHPWIGDADQGTRAVPSVEPLLMAINSKSVNDWFRIVPSAWGRSDPPLLTDSTTLTVGA